MVNECNSLDSRPRATNMILMIATTDRCQQHPARCFSQIFHTDYIINKKLINKKETNVTYHLSSYIERLLHALSSSTSI